jgi:hypothetical protein
MLPNLKLSVFIQGSFKQELFSNFYSSQIKSNWSKQSAQWCFSLRSKNSQACVYASNCMVFSLKLNMGLIALAPGSAHTEKRENKPFIWHGKLRWKGTFFGFIGFIR